MGPFLKRFIPLPEEQEIEIPFEEALNIRAAARFIRDLPMEERFRLLKMVWQLGAKAGAVQALGAVKLH